MVLQMWIIHDFDAAVFYVQVMTFTQLYVQVMTFLNMHC